MIVKYLTIKNHSPFLFKTNYLKLFSYPELRLITPDKAEFWVKFVTFKNHVINIEVSS
jgi:hypothetical protein